MNKHWTMLWPVLILVPMCMALFHAPVQNLMQVPNSTSPNQPAIAMQTFSAVVYTSGNQTGYMIMNITASNSEMLYLVGNKTVTLTINFIGSTTAGVTINNQSFTLAMDSPVAFVDPPTYSYFVELMDINYLPRPHTITLKIYGQPNLPRHSAHGAAPTTTVAETTVPITAVPVNESGSSAGIPLPLVLPVGVGVLVAILVGFYALATRRPRKRSA